LNGVPRDKDGLKNFMESPSGGAWNSWEIRSFETPSRQQLLQELSGTAGSADFVLLHFGGHGCVYDDSDDTTICLNDQEEIEVGKLRIRVPKQLLLIDCCRSIIRRVPIEESLEKRAFAAMSMSADRSYAASCRAMYDQAVEQAEEGCSIAFSCSPGKAANDDPSFTRGMVLLAEQWSTLANPIGHSARRVLNLPTAVGLVSAWLDEKNIIQVPMVNNGRRINSFPVAIA